MSAFLIRFQKILFGASIFASSLVPAGEIDFARDIRPILSENCTFCHGPDEEQREAGLRVDTEDGMRAVIEVEHRADSELYRRLITEDSDSQMPPPHSNRSLTAREIDLIGQWIDAGARWSRHWSFRPIERPPIPNADRSDTAPIRNAIDVFVRNKLTDTPLVASSEADRRTLIRRLSLDLTGLPPTPNEVADFLSDESPRAYVKLVTRLLESPAYGERMTWDWLDAARYADTNGYQGDNERTMWPWRDWVVQAFNKNLRYDEFTRWQIAGDLIPDATQEQKLATGFFRNHMINGEGGRIPEENRVEYVMDMSETLGTVWLGLTLNCCRCHDHKYDPLSNEDYYSLFAFFNQTPVKGNGGNAQTAPILETPSPQQQERLTAFDQRIAAIDRELATLAKQTADGLQDWEGRMREQTRDGTQWKVLNPSTVFASGAALRKLSDGSILATNKNLDQDTYTFVASSSQGQITGIRLEALQHESLTGKGLSRSASGNFVLTSFEVTVVDKTVANEKANVRFAVPIESASATFEQFSHEVARALDGDDSTGWAVYEDGKVDRPHAAVFRFAEPVVIPPDAELKVIMRHDSRHKQHSIGRFRLAATQESDPQLSSLPDDLQLALLQEPSKRSDADKRVIGKAYRESIPQYLAIQKRLESVVAMRSKLKSQIPKVMVLADQEERRETFVLERGLYNKPTEVVQAALPSFLADGTEIRLDGENPVFDRKKLVDWLVGSDNPLTARVTVNRLWQQLFGIGLVKTTEDFGAQGEIPLHLELLNWLAAEFRDSGWDVKHLLRLVVTSHTYRQSSKIESSDAYEYDPENRYLSRGARYRLPSWMIRDQALAASGLLSKKIGGKPVNTYQPEGVWEEASFGKKTYVRDDGESLYRRSLYVFWRRIIAPTMFFDAASRQNCTVKVSRTNTPLHALQTLNDITYVEAARALAQRVLDDDSPSNEKDESARDRLDRVMNRVLARDASDEEAAILLRGLDRSIQEYRNDPAKANTFVGLGESERDEGIDPVIHASWTALCLIVLNMDETISRE